MVKFSVTDAASCITSLNYHPDLGLVSTDQDGIISTWDISNLEGDKELKPKSSVNVADAIQSLTIIESTDRPLAVVGIDCNLVSVWDLKEGKCLKNMQPGSGVNCLVASEDGKKVYSGEEAGALCEWDVMTGEQTNKKEEAHGDWVNGVALKGDLLVTAGEDSSVRWWKEFEEVQMLDFEDPCNAVLFVGDELLVGVADRVVRLHAEPKSSDDVPEVPAEVQQGFDVALEEAKKIEGEEEQQAKMMEIMEEVMQQMNHLKEEAGSGVEIIGTLDGHEDDVRVIIPLLEAGAITNPPTVATASDDGTIKIWRLEKEPVPVGEIRPQGTTGGEPSPIFSLYQSGQYLLSGDNDGRILINKLPSLSPPETQNKGD